MYIIGILFALILSGCVAGANQKALTPTEVQVLSKVMAKRLILPELSATQKVQVQAGLAAARSALETTDPLAVMVGLGRFLGPENEDIAELICVLLAERVDLSQLPELEGKAYVFAVLAGVEGGIK